MRRNELLIQVEKKLAEMKNQIIFIPKKNIYYIPNDHKIEYIVDRSKGKVTALLISRFNEKVLHGETSKCHEDEVFNADLGKFIATWKMFYGTLSNLHSGYVNVAQPTNFEDGQIVRHKSNTGIFRVKGVVVQTIKSEPTQSFNLIYGDGMIPVEVIYSPMTSSVDGEQFNCRIEELEIIEDSKTTDMDFDFYGRYTTFSNPFDRTSSNQTIRNF